MLTLIDDRLTLPELAAELVHHAAGKGVEALELEAECPNGNAYKVIVIKQ